jgi:hypothetical protein
MSTQPLLNRIDWRPVSATETITVDTGGPRARELVLIAPLVRLLMTSWAYDSVTRTLFTADAFSHALLSASDGPMILSERDDEVTPRVVREHLLTKFEWLAGADRAPIVAALRSVFASYDIETVAPAYGRVIHGRSVVARHQAMLADVLASGAADAREG